MCSNTNNNKQWEDKRTVKEPCDYWLGYLSVCLFFMCFLLSLSFLLCFRALCIFFHLQINPRGKMERRKWRRFLSVDVSIFTELTTQEHERELKEKHKNRSEQYNISRSENRKSENEYVKSFISMIMKKMNEEWKKERKEMCVYLVYLSPIQIFFDYLQWNTLRLLLRLSYR